MNIEFTHFLGLFLFSLSLTGTPGPNNIMLLTSSLNFGGKRTISHGLGVMWGYPLMLLLIGLGLGELFLAYPVIHKIIKVLGISYLLFLAWRIANTEVEIRLDSNSKPLTFVQALLFQWVNPKAWVMAITTISAFTTVGEESFNQVMILVLAALCASLVSVNLWVFGGIVLSKLIQHPGQRRVFNISMAILLVVSALPMLTSSL